MVSKWLALALVGALGFLLLGADLWLALAWWAALFLIGLIFLPVAAWLFSRFFDLGYLFSKILGLAGLTFCLWFFSSLRILPFHRATILALLIVAAAGIWVGLRAQVKTLFTTKGPGAIFIYEEALFLLGLIFFAFVRGQLPDIHGIEKFMDFAFLNNLLRTEYMPPVDMWFSGKPANYYYYGHYVFAFLTKLTGLAPKVTYNLAMATLFSFGFSLTFSLAGNLLYLSGKRKWPSIILGGFVSAGLLAFGGNLHTFVYTTAVPFLKSLGLYQGEVKPYFFADPRSYIGTNPPTNDKLITEYPSYSYILGDLHAQIIDVFFVLTFLALLLALTVRLSQEIRNPQEPDRWYRLPPEMGFMLLLLPVMWMTNAWDYPIYLIVLSVFLLGINLIKYDFSGRAVSRTLFGSGKMLVLSLLLLAPYLIHFRNPTEGVRLTDLGHLFVPLYWFQMLVIWGYQIFLAGLFWVYLLKTQPRYQAEKKAASAKKKTRRPAVEAQSGADTPKETESSLEAESLMENKSVPKPPRAPRSFVQKIRRILAKAPAADLFVFLISICGIGLVLGAEFFYQKDVSPPDLYRANTVWKVTLQAFILFDLVAGYAAIRIFSIPRPKVKQYWLGGAVALAVGLAMMYPFWSIGPVNVSAYHGLDGTAYMRQSYPDDYRAIEWLNQNVSGQPVTLEAWDHGYTDYCRISANTGLPTIIGWLFHQSYWRGSRFAQEQQERTQAVNMVYEGADIAAKQEVLRKYQVKYIVIGQLERQKYPALDEAKLLSLGKVVFDSPGTKIIEVNRE